ncbi:MAG: ABC transporter substrate-binding protein [Acidimicrobiales bacterium]
MMVKRLRWAVIVAGTLALALVLAACSNASTTVTTIKPGASLPKTGPAPGVTSNSITVGTLATESGALSPGFGEIVDGVQAYFDMVNAQGGVNGRKLELKYNLDDQGNSTNDETQARNLVTQDHVFAVVGVGTPFFYGSTFLAQSQTPTFGYVVTSNWNTYPNLFGAYGSYLDYNTESPTAAFLAKEVGAKSVAVLAYSFAPSKDPCQDVVNGLSQFGVHVGFQDLNFGIGGNPTADVQQMVAKHVDMTFSCMEGSDNLSFQQSMRQYGLTNVHSVWLNGYSRSLIAANPTLMNGVIFGVQHVPFEAETQFPGVYPGLAQYFTEMQKYEPKWIYDDTAMQGWINAAQFVAGLRAIGSNVTQNRLIDAINQETDYNAGGLVPPINWTNAHTTALPPYCGAYVEVENGTTKVVFTNGTAVFSCVGANATQVAAPPNTPGA